MKILNIDPLDAHDRLSYMKEENRDGIQQMIEKIIAQDPFDGRAFYIFAHKRASEERGKTRLIWQPRLQKPKAVTNSMLYKVNPNNIEEVRIVWIIPERSQWTLYAKGSMFENESVIYSIEAFQNKREELEAPDADDPSDDEAARIYASLYPNLVKNN